MAVEEIVVVVVEQQGVELGGVRRRLRAGSRRCGDWTGKTWRFSFS